jgi:hypothetical protein
MDTLSAARAAIEYSTQPRVAFFDDPAVDRVLGITMAVAQEVGQVLEKLDTIERVLVQRGTLAPGELQAFVPTPAIAAERLTMQQAFCARLLRVVEQELVALRGEQAATAATAAAADAPPAPGAARPAAA